MASIRIRRGSFEVRVQHNGQVHSRSFSSEAEARRWGIGVENGFIQPGTMCKRVAGCLTLAQAIERYAEEVSQTHRGARQERVRLKQLATTPLAKKPLDKVEPADLKALRDSMLERGLSTTSARLMLMLVSAIYRHAHREWGLKLGNPVSEIRVPPPAPARQRRLSADEEVRLLYALNRCRHPAMRALVPFALETGMRRSEMLNLRWSDVDLERRLATLPTTKNGSPRWVPLTTRAIELLKTSLARGAERPFDLSVANVENAWKQVIRRAGISDLRLHDLRHEALSRWAHRLRGDVFKLSLVSGHRTLQMARRYVHPVESELIASQNFV